MWRGGYLLFLVELSTVNVSLVKTISVSVKW